MRAQIGIDVVPIFISLVQNLLQQKNIRVTYAWTSNFRMKLVRFMPLYFVVMPQSIITVIEVPFMLTPIIMVSGIRSRPHILRGKKFVNLHEDFPKEVNMIFAS